jgi:hypothetical protein
MMAKPGEVGVLCREIEVDVVGLRGGSGWAAAIVEGHGLAAPLGGFGAAKKTHRCLWSA